MYCFSLCCSLCTQAVAPPNAHGRGTSTASIWAVGCGACPWPWQVCSIWTAGGGSVRVRPCSGSRLDGVARRAPPTGRRIRVGVTCKMFWRMLHVLRLCVQVAGCLMHELFYI